MLPSHGVQVFLVLWPYLCRAGFEHSGLEMPCLTLELIISWVLCFAVAGSCLCPRLDFLRDNATGTGVADHSAHL